MGELYQGTALVVPQAGDNTRGLYESNTSISKVALRSDCSNGRPWLVLVVAKNVRAGLTILSGRAWRVGLAITGG